MINVLVDNVLYHIDTGVIVIGVEELDVQRSQRGVQDQEGQGGVQDQEGQGGVQDQEGRLDQRVTWVYPESLEHLEHPVIVLRV